VGVLSLTPLCIGVNVTQQDVNSVDADLSLGFTNITKYDDSLYQLGQMLEAYGCPTSLIQVRGILNRTASQKLPQDVSQLTITALNKIGKHIKIVDYDEDQLGIDLAIGTHTMERIVPDLALRGAITEFDKKIERDAGMDLDISSKTFGAGTDAGIGGSRDSSAAGTSTAMDFQLIDYRTQTLLPGIQAANRINLYESSQGGDLDLSFAGSGIDFKSNVKKTQGLHATLRLLVELSIVELIGKYNLVPYWRCLPNAEPDLMVVQNYKREITNLQNPMPVLKRLAVAHGYQVDPFSNFISESENEILLRMRQDLNVPPNASETEFITALWLTVPVEKGAQNMQRYYVQKQQEALYQQAALSKQQQIEQQQMEEAQQLESEKRKKRTTFKFGSEDTF